MYQISPMNWVYMFLMLLIMILMTFNHMKNYFIWNMSLKNKFMLLYN